MGLFNHKKKLSEEDILKAEEQFFEESFREELRNHGRWYFEKIIKENGDLFRQDLEKTIDEIKGQLDEHVAGRLDTAIAQIGDNLSVHLTQQLGEKFEQFQNSIQESQTKALEGLSEQAKSLDDQYKQLGTAIQKSISNQGVMVETVFQETNNKMNEVKASQEKAMQTMADTAKAIEDHYQQLTTELKENLEKQQKLQIDAFENNMARIIEHYLLGALGEQYDLKAQLPAIIQQMETNKQAIVDDMKL